MTHNNRLSLFKSSYLLLDMDFNESSFLIISLKNKHGLMSNIHEWFYPL